ncbi:MAG TPA: tRNA (adenosine(37)-N6)-threonylcarbamoyltransferase complex transferase subunit TsaD [Clostridiaceae bacterium]|jgi:N6-L-threonylcarbamoyladenine synthase|nr:tRNA (adenosine(37)-N6)-threonylcarbamoyltransferase complex transferase subunit TsaD [Clostridiaceae bacterium]
MIKNIQNTYILGIESSCDETAAAIVNNGRNVISNIIFSSADLHKIYGGVVPEIASRKHAEVLPYVLDQTMTKAGITRDQIAAIAVTKGPGLVGSLLVGVSAAKTLALIWQKPLYGIHHLAGHIAANYLTYPELEPPFLSLIVSGAHSHIVLVKSYLEFEVIARTRDDAPGEAFDKIARELNLGYPGGPIIDSLAKQGKNNLFELPQPKFEKSLDFSFSGLKTATLNKLNQIKQKAALLNQPWEDLINKADFAATFQSAVIKNLLDHILEAVAITGQNKLVLAGGVAANSELRSQFQATAEQLALELYLPELQYCTDNAAMIAAQGYYAYQDQRPETLALNAYAMLDLENA